MHCFEICNKWFSTCICLCLTFFTRVAIIFTIVPNFFYCLLDMVSKSLAFMYYFRSFLVCDPGCPVVRQKIETDAQACAVPKRKLCMDQSNIVYKCLCDVPMWYIASGFHASVWIYPLIYFFFHGAAMIICDFKWVAIVRSLTIMFVADLFPPSNFGRRCVKNDPMHEFYIFPSAC